MQNLIQLAQDIRQLVAKNKTSEAIEKLLEIRQDYEEVDNVILQSARFEALRNRRREGTISDSIAVSERTSINQTLLEFARKLDHAAKADTHIFLSYSEKVNHEDLAKDLWRKLKEESFEVFWGKEDFRVGDKPPEVVPNVIRNSDYFIALISEEANYDEFVLYQVQEAMRLGAKYGKPVILPVRIGQEFHNSQSPLHNYLRGIHHLRWVDNQDTGKVFHDLLEAISNRNTLEDENEELSDSDYGEKKNNNDRPFPLASLRLGDQDIPTASTYYIERKNENTFIELIHAPGSLLRIRGPRQYGKTSMLNRIVTYAQQLDFHVAHVDFQFMTEATLRNLDSLLQAFCLEILDDLDLELDDHLKEYWDEIDDMDPNMKIRRFIKRNILKKLDKPLLLALDEVDKVFSFPQVSTDFFSMLRSIYSESIMQTKPNWQKLRMAISYSTEAKLAIQNLNQSPFNVGEEARITPFTFEQIEDLANRYQLGLSSSELTDLEELLGGQPYLTRKALHIISRGDYSFEGLVRCATDESGPFSDHLRHHHINIIRHEELALSMKKVINNGGSLSDKHFMRLAAAGLVKGNHQRPLVACKLYQEYFRKAL